MSRAIWSTRAGGGRHGRVEHDVRAARVDPVDGLRPVGVIEREVFLSEDLAPIGRGDFMNLPVHHMRPDVVGRGQVERPCSDLLHHPRDQRLDLLCRNGAGAEQERVVFLPLVLLGVDVERLAVHHRRLLDGLPGRAEDAAQEDVDMVILDELGGGGRRLLVVGRAVLDDQLDVAAEQAAGRVEFVHDQCRDVGLAGAHDAEGAGLVGDHADLDCV
jgi:hypothetical protein